MSTVDRFEQPGDEASPRVCWCMHVHRATIVRAIAAGASDLDAIAAATKAGTGCGTCRSDLLALLAEKLEVARADRTDGGGSR